MSTEIKRAKGRYAGLLAYLKSLLRDLNIYISSEDRGQDKLLGFKGELQPKTKLVLKVVS